MGFLKKLKTQYNFNDIFFFKIENADLKKISIKMYIYHLAVKI